MLTKRIIPCLDVRDGRVTKGVKFKNNVDLGDPVEMAVAYSEGGADELVFYDITASAERRPTDIGMVAAVAESIRIPVILYNVPGRTGVNLSPETVLRLAQDVENIVAVKEASGDQFQCDRLIRALQVVRPDFRVFSGNDDQAFHLVCSGGDGVISVLSNVVPAQTSALMNAALGGNLAEGRRLHLQLLPLMKDLFHESNPIPVKYAASLLDLCRNELRLPLVPASQGTCELVHADLLELDVLEDDDE